MLIYKEGKDSKACESYRPISLINADTNILVTILAALIGAVISTAVHADQNSFMPNKSISQS